MITYWEVDQKSERWQKLRAGIPTASEFDKALRVYGKGGLQSAENKRKIESYATRKVAEILLKRPVQKDIFTRSMEYGSITESTAAKLYEMTNGLQTKIVGFVTTDDGHYGASPDRFVGDVGMWECKCGDDDTHVSYMLNPDKLYKNYEHQTQGQLFVCDEKEWVDLYAYHMEMPPVVIRVTRDKAYQDKLAEDLENFRDVMNGMVEKLISTGYMKV